MWAAVGRELAVDPARLQSWAQKRHKRRPVSLLRPVQVVPEARGRSELPVVTPGGLRIEALVAFAQGKPTRSAMYNPA
jgi:hypothetical protein